MSPPAAPASSRSKDRHKKRRSIHLRPRIHALIAELAEKNYRPLRMEIELALFDYLRKHGVEVPADLLSTQG